MTRLIRIPIFVLLLLVGLGVNAQSATTVVLNGLASLFGEPRAFLQVTAPGCLTQNITLVPGETYRGIKLVAVDMTAFTVRIDHDGQIENIRICSPPELATAAAANDAIGGNAPTATSAAASAPPRVGSGPLSDPGRERSGGGGLAGGGTTANADASTASPGASGSGSGNEASPAGTHIYYWWMEQAQKIEQARLDTAQQVLAGELPPQPLTPLTPANTSALLIGSDSVFIEHGRGMVVSN
jgi:hypothetical protein